MSAIQETIPLLGRQKPTPLPKIQLLLICFLRVTEPIAFVVCFPFINQMLLDEGIVSDPKKAGFKAGVIESIFSLAQLFTVFFWGTASDRFGRKPVLIIGCIGSSLSGGLFGLSKSFTAMIVTRSLAGLANGNVVIIKSMLAEITDDTNSSRAFSFFPLSYAVGTIIASYIGGTFANIATKYPALGTSYPILRHYPFLLPCLIAASFPLLSGVLALLFLKETLPVKDLTNEAQHEPKVSIGNLLTRDVRNLLINFSLLALQATALVGLLPLFCFTPVEDGGLGFSEERIGQVLSIRAVATIGVQILAFPKLQRMMGTVRLYRLMMILFIPTFLGLPVLNIFARMGKDSWVWLGMSVVLLVGAAANMAFSCNMLMVNDVAPNRQSLGAVNGLAQVAASGMRALGPGAATVLFALSVDRHALGGNLIWLVLAIVAIAGSVTALLL